METLERLVMSYRSFNEWECMNIKHNFLTELLLQVLFITGTLTNVSVHNFEDFPMKTLSGILHKCFPCMILKSFVLRLYQDFVQVFPGFCTNASKSLTTIFSVSTLTEWFVKFQVNVFQTTPTLTEWLDKFQANVFQTVL